MFDMLKRRTKKEITPAYICAAIICHCNPIAKRLSDEKLIKMVYRGYVGRKLNLENPQYYTEKLNWLKLHDHNPLYNVLVDKYEVKKYVAEKIGVEYIIPTLGVWDAFDEINFEKLPKQFVLKCTHNSGGVVIIKDKSLMDRKAVKRTLEKSLKRNFGMINREWPYIDVKPRIIAEAYMKDITTNELRDYKFFCFNGKAKAVYVITGREKEGPFLDFFDMDFKHLDVSSIYPNAPTVPQKPETFEKMKIIANILSEDIPHVRVDLYEINGKVYFGEYTFYHIAGWVPMRPEKWEKVFGDWLSLPKV